MYYCYEMEFIMSLKLVLVVVMIVIMDTLYWPFCNQILYIEIVTGNFSNPNKKKKNSQQPNKERKKERKKEERKKNFVFNLEQDIQSINHWLVLTYHY